MNRRNELRQPLSTLTLWPKKSFFLLFFAIAFSNCTDFGKKQSNASNDAPTKQIVELIYTDEGAVVPNPIGRKVVVSLRDSANPQLTYCLVQGDVVTQKNDFKLTGEQLDLVVDNVAALADIPDGLEYKPGKAPCMGARGVEVQMVFNNGDTSRFTISGGARCDRDIAAPWKTVDSVATEVFKSAGQ